jgi:short-subunit dehydrogenase
MSSQPRVQLSGTTALVTGATGGLGQAIATALAGRGASVIVTGRRESELSALAERLGGRAVVADLAVRGDVDRLAHEAADADVVVANAALPASGQLEDFTRGEIDRMLEINLRAPIVLAKELAPRMVQRGHGQLVFISSLSGKAASPASSMYSATKFGLRGFALALRQDLATSGVGVSVVAPGFIREAGMFHEANVSLPPGTGTRSPQDVADAVLKAIDEDRAELDVAPAALRVGAAFASLAPGLAARARRRMGSHRVASDMAAGQRDKR